MRLRSGLSFFLCCLGFAVLETVCASVPATKVPTLSPGPSAVLGTSAATPSSPEGVESASVLLWGQSLSTASPNAYVDQDFPDQVPYTSYLADDFTNAVPWTIRSIFTPGRGWGSFTSLASATSLTWSIYSDNWGVPSGSPGDGTTPYWTLTLPPGDPRVQLTVGYDGMLSNVTLNLTTPINLPGGTWWLVVYPTMPLTSGQWGRHVADTSNLAQAVIINPGGGFNIGTTWTDLGVIGAAQYDLAFQLFGQACSSSTTITMSALGGTTADWPVTHGSQTGRLIRSTPAGTCAAPKACPGLNDSTARAYDAFSFVNHGCQATCVTVTLATTCSGSTTVFAQAYLGTYDPANLCSNYLADLGSSSSGTPLDMSFTVPAGAAFTVVVNEVYAGAGCPSGYTLTVSGLFCPPPPPTPTSFTAAGTCEGVNLYWVASPLTTYHVVYRGSTCGSATLSIAGYMTSPFEDTYGGDGGQTYTYWMYAVNGCGESAFTPCVTATRLGPATVGNNLLLSRPSGNLHFAWSDVSNALSYRVYQDTAPDGAFGTVTGTAASGATGLTVPTPGQSLLFYKVAAVNDCGVGPKVAGGPNTEVWGVRSSSLGELPERAPIPPTIQVISESGEAVPPGEPAPQAPPPRPAAGAVDP